MASKRVTASALDWGAMALKVRPEQKNGFNGLKMKVDKHLRAVNSLPADLPKVDFAAYKSRIAVPGMVDNFEKAYAGLQIPYPSDQGRLAEIDAQAVQVKAGYETFVAESNTRIAGYTTEIDAQAVQVKAGYEAFVAESNTRIAGYTTEIDAQAVQVKAGYDWPSGTP
eukprot:TRINITY_DN2973_c1_g2_i3.p1 TRINITY_DN2973_c1_g2~~TRINITY_DN2973_c1_g2_i3.p1  ORF type:complete len:168 (+),score=61.77 TRINITY_DN2973_c1_g2_i3:31-534(+)